jgi:hypothetical protein
MGKDKLDKKWQQSATIVGGAGTVLTSALISANLLPDSSFDPMNAVFNNGLELIRALFAVYAIYGARKVAGKIAAK